MFKEAAKRKTNLEALLILLWVDLKEMSKGKNVEVQIIVK